MYDVMGWIGSEAGVGSRFWCERAQGLGFVAGVQRLGDTNHMCLIVYCTRFANAGIVRGMEDNVAAQSVKLKVGI